MYLTTSLFSPTLKDIANLEVETSSPEAQGMDLITSLFSPIELTFQETLRNLPPGNGHHSHLRFRRECHHHGRALRSAGHRQVLDEVLRHNGHIVGLGARRLRRDKKLDRGLLELCHHGRGIPFCLAKATLLPALQGGILPLFPRKDRVGAVLNLQFEHPVTFPNIMDSRHLDHNILSHNLAGSILNLLDKVVA